MAEYYAVLSKAIASLDANGPDTRRAVYDKARNALIGQLKAIDPPLPTHEISRQRLELEEAIRKVEREASTAAPVRASANAVARPLPARRVASASPSADEAGLQARAPEGAPPSRQSPQDVFRRAIQEAERVAANGSRMERQPANGGRTEPPTGWTNDRGDVPPPAARAVPAPQRYAEEPPVDNGPRLAPDYDWDPPRELPPPESDYDHEPPYAEPEDEVAPAPRPLRQARGAAPNPRVVADSYEDDPAPHADDRRRGGGSAKRKTRGRVPDDAELLEREARPSRLPVVILLILILAMLVGLGALAWWQREPIGELLASFDSKSSTVTPAATVTPAPAADASSKDPDRLLTGDGAAAPAAAVRNVTPSPDGSAPAAADAGPTPLTPPGAATTTASADPTNPDPDALVAQRATLYEEPLDASAAASGVIAIDASVRWSFTSGPDGPEVVANVDVPDRSLKVKITFRRNTDKTLPASHVVEVVIDAPTAFPGKGVREVPRIVLKPAEDQRGQPLIGASAKVADGFFWIALSGVDTDVASNTALMRDQSWIDLPLVYETGQRAILTFEKGNPGARVFERALAAWAG